MTMRTSGDILNDLKNNKLKANKMLANAKDAISKKDKAKANMLFDEVKIISDSTLLLIDEMHKRVKDIQEDLPDDVKKQGADILSKLDSLVKEKRNV